MIVSTSNNHPETPISNKDIERSKDLCSTGSNKKNPGEKKKLKLSVVLGKNNRTKELNSRKKPALDGRAGAVTASMPGGGSDLCTGGEKNISHRRRNSTGTKKNHPGLGPENGTAGQTWVWTYPE